MKAAKPEILIIDDDARNIFALTAVLQSKGFECRSAIGALEGLEMLLKPNEIKMVLMDMMMPDIDGYEAIAQMKANEQLCALPVIAVTAQAMKGDKEKCIAAGASGYISKPVDIDALVGLLHQHLKH